MSGWVTRVTFDGDAVEARNLIIQVLVAAGFVDVRTTTVEAWMDKQMSEPPAPMSHAPGRSSEHAFQMVSKTMGARPNT